MRFAGLGERPATEVTARPAARAGYYPACRNGNCTTNPRVFASPGLRSSANGYSFYGEVWDASHPAATLTEMGNGLYGDDPAGWKYVPYMREMKRFTGLQLYQVMTNDGQLSMTDTNCYRSSNGGFVTFSSQSGWDNYFFYGGPGANNTACR
jgi:hypothetical protein